jgi:4'-phosphopantetheinyl transferase
MLLFWSSPPKYVTLPDGEVHVWRADLDLLDTLVQELQRLLAADELDRAAKFYFERGQKRFIVGRALLRIILSRYLDIKPELLHFSYNKHGKPALIAQDNQEGLRFNLSHCDGTILYAITRDREIGVDLERVRATVEHQRIAERIFSPKELATIYDLPAEMKLEAFFRGWTRKEAYIKARGKGLAMPLDGFEVLQGSGALSISLNSRENLHEVAHWTLRDLEPGSGYVGALAVQGDAPRLKCWRWSEKLHQIY